MPPKTPKFHIRPALPTPSDIAFIASAFDSTLPYLSTIGSGAQWGAIPFSTRSGFNDETLLSLEQSESFRQTDKFEGEDGAVRVFIAEAETETDGPGASRGGDDDDDVEGGEGSGKGRLPVGMITVREDFFAEFLRNQEVLQQEICRAKDFVYLEVLVTDYSAKEKRNGAGAALIEHVKEYARERGKGAVYVDCWGGNDEGLTR